jgi:hypothetical protein
LPDFPQLAPPHQYVSVVSEIQPTHSGRLTEIEYSPGNTDDSRSASLITPGNPEYWLTVEEGDFGDSYESIAGRSPTRLSNPEGYGLPEPHSGDKITSVNSFSCLGRR